MSRLAAHHAPSNDALGILHWNPPFAAFDQDDKSDHRHHHYHNRQRLQHRPLMCDEGVGVHAADGTRQTHDDAGENDQRHTVADTAIGNLLAQPHDEG